LRPGRSQRRFAEPCRRLDQGQSLSGELGNHVHEPWTRDQPLASRRNDLGREEFELLPVEDSALRRGWLAFGARQSRLCQWCVPIGAPPGPDPSNRASVPHYTTWTDIGKARGRFNVTAPPIVRLGADRTTSVLNGAWSPLLHEVESTNLLPSPPRLAEEAAQSSWDGLEPKT
jgi:hypothetical protein